MDIRQNIGTLVPKFLGNGPQHIPGQVQKHLILLVVLFLSTLFLLVFGQVAILIWITHVNGPLLSRLPQRKVTSVRAHSSMLAPGLATTSCTCASSPAARTFLCYVQEYIHPGVSIPDHVEPQEIADWHLPQPNQDVGSQ